MCSPVVTVGLNLRNAFPRFNLTAVMLLLTTQLLIKLINSDIDKPGIYMGFSLFGPNLTPFDGSLATNCHLSSDLEGIFHHNFFVELLFYVYETLVLVLVQSGA